MIILEELAKGGFGRVERVRLPDGSIVARKVFAPDPVQTAGADIEKLKKRFVREVRTQSALPHDLFVPVLAHDMNVEPPWFTMPLADGNLEAYLPSMKSNPSQLLAAFGHILDSLKHLHTLDYVHRDLKPANVLLHQGRWKLADLGLVLPTTSKSTKLSSNMTAWGTLAYIAPEQYSEFGSVTAAADIFAFGCLLHDIYGDGNRTPMQRVGCHGPLGVVIEKCTEIDPRKRFKSIGGLRGALFEVLATPPAPPQAGAVTDAASEWARKLESVPSMSPADIAGLARFLRTLSIPMEGAATFTALDEARLVALHGRDVDAWTEIAKQYCEWATGTFNFDYCDVVAGRLRTIYALGSVELKALAAIAAAQLAASHHRFFVMSVVLELCGPATEESVARRIAIEIRALELQFEFRGCATVIQRTVDAYHPYIAAVLPPPPPPPPPVPFSPF